MPSIRITAALAVLFAGFTVAAAQAAEPASAPIGTWLTEKGDAHIRISHCGNRLCGTIIWVKDTIDPKTGKPPVDSDNPNPRLRHRRIVGLRIFAMKPDGHDTWKGGIYNSNNGQTYGGSIRPKGHDALKVSGCFGLICGSETWHRIGR